MELRRATPKDQAELAYLALKWDSELPEWCQQIKGRAAAAQRLARILTENHEFHTFVLPSADGESIGAAVSLRIFPSLYAEELKGKVIAYVRPRLRSGKAIGVRLLIWIREYADSLGVRSLELEYWADSLNAGKALRRIGFNMLTTNYATSL